MEGNILITGGSGKLGKWLKRVFPRALAPARDELDIGDEAAIIQYLEKHKPDIIIHSAAITNTRICETDRQLAWNVNVIGTECLAEHAVMLGKAYFVFISTAGVFSGEEGNYDENAIPYPRNFYCFTKYVAEERIRKYDGVCIVRTNFIENKKWSHKGAFTDRYGTYLLAPDVAVAVKDIISKRPTGVIHVCGDRKVSLYEAAKKVDASVQPMTCKENMGLALPRDISLTTVRWKPYEFGFSLRELA